MHVLAPKCTKPTMVLLCQLSHNSNVSFNLKGPWAGYNIHKECF